MLSQQSHQHLSESLTVNRDDKTHQISANNVCLAGFCSIGGASWFCPLERKKIEDKVVFLPFFFSNVKFQCVLHCSSLIFWRHSLACKGLGGPDFLLMYFSLSMSILEQSQSGELCVSAHFSRYFY